MAHPACDRHPNLQMFSCWLKKPTGITFGYICPVPSCVRCRDDEGYFDFIEQAPLSDIIVMQRNGPSGLAARCIGSVGKPMQAK